jgi:hypothetical protein
MIPHNQRRANMGRKLESFIKAHGEQEGRQMLRERQQKSSASSRIARRRKRHAQAAQSAKPTNKE